MSCGIIEGGSQALEWLNGSKEKDEISNCFPHGCSKQKMEELDATDQNRKDANQAIALLGLLSSELMAVRAAKAGTTAAAEVCADGACFKLGQCFVAGTPVHTLAGTKAIEAIEIGDVVISHDPMSGVTTLKPVIGLSRNPGKQIIKISIYNKEKFIDVIYASTEHPFWVEDIGWTNANALTSGMRLHQLKGEQLIVQSVELTPGLQPTYNLEVADFHTYFVGASGVLVHNTDICTKAGALQPGWIAKDLYSKMAKAVDVGKLPVETMKKFEAALKSFTSGSGGTGIKPLTGGGYELKILGKDGGYRLYGDLNKETGQIIFNTMEKSH
jgi:hypothetical protein